LKVHAIQTGTVQVKPSQQRGEGRARVLKTMTDRRWTEPLPIYAWLIEHPEGLIVVDTGETARVAEPGYFPRWHPYFKLAVREQVRPEDEVGLKLEALGFSPRDVRRVILTHLHTDHASAISEFASSTFVVSEPEWVAATTDRRPLLRGYRPAHYDFVFDYRTIDYDRGGIDSYATFGRTFDLFGDGSIHLAYTPGHSAGHQAVICRLRERDFVIAGDAIYTHRQLEDGPLPPRPLDMHQFRRSLQELRLFRREFPHAIITPGHDPSFYTQLDARYE
jgi:glyoxylase-like metal-dependent hydrolase (beta-lactamase superfamily II)